MPSIMAPCCLHSYGIKSGSKTVSVMEVVSFSDALVIGNY